MLPKISPTKTREFRPLKMSTKISVKNALLLQVLLPFLLLATFVTTAVAWKKDLALNRDIESPLIEIHRVKRGLWDLFGGTDTDPTTTETTGICEIRKFACDVSRCISAVDHTLAIDRQCNPETEFSCLIEGQCIPLEARCDRIFDCVDGSDEANCTPPETTTTTDVSEVQATRCMKPVLEVSEKEVAGEFKELTAANECFEKEYAELWKKLAGIEQRLKDHDLRIARLAATVSDRSSVTPSTQSEQRFSELECRAFVTSLIMSQKKYFP